MSGLWRELIARLEWPMSYHMVRGSEIEADKSRGKGVANVFFSFFFFRREDVKKFENMVLKKFISF